MDHIQVEVRDAATAMFWLPEILTDVRLITCFGSAGDEQVFWKTRLYRMGELHAYVAGQEDVFDWPVTQEVQRQYIYLMSTWARLLAQPDVSKMVLVSTSALGDADFQWKVWWKLVHTDPRFCPHGCEGALELFHFYGMLGTSEAVPESVASMLKYFSPKSMSSLLPTRVVEKVILKCAGIRGIGDDDMFIAKCWAEWFGSTAPKDFTFDCSSSCARRKKFPLGRGSKTIHNFLKRGRKQTWANSASTLRGGRLASAVGSLQWRKHLRRERGLLV